MGLTILGPTSNPIPYPTYPTFVEVKQTWGGTWQPVPELELEQASVSCCGHDMDSCVLRHRYGATVKHPWQTTASSDTPWNLDGWWLRLSLVGPKGTQPIWIGRIHSDGRNIFGDGNNGGRQRIQAYGPQMLLRKRSISESVWSIPTGSTVVQNRVQWLAPMNDRVGHSGWLIGNRTASKVGVDAGEGVTLRTYIFGGTSLWTVPEFIRYLLTWFMNDSLAGGPAWRLGGCVHALAETMTSHAWPEVTTVDNMLHTLISPKRGVDYKVVFDPSRNAFVVWAFALQSRTKYVFGQKLPVNSDKVRIESGKTPANLSTTVTRNSDHRFGTIRVLGKRIVVCCTIVGPDVNTSEGGTGGSSASHGSLVPAWNTGELQSLYIEGHGSVPGGDPNEEYPEGSEERADYCRRAERYRDVFSFYACPPSFSLKSLGAVYATDASGVLDTTLEDSEGAAKDPPWQNRIRKTLHWLPLIAGWDYSQDPPLNVSDVFVPDDVNYMPQFLSPMVWLYNEDDGYQPADMVGVSVGVPKLGLGVRLRASPSHLLALNVEGADDMVTGTDPLYDMGMAYATVAFESDCRLRMEYALPDALPGADGVEEILEPDAELWVVAPQTVVDVDDEDSRNVKTSGPETLILRDDRTYLASIMAGAIARYNSQRARATVVSQGLVPWGGLLGQMLTVIDTGAGKENIDAPITSITWTGGENPQTTINTGFAQGR